MIRAGASVARATGRERWALALLIDLAALLPVDDPNADVVDVDVARGGAGAGGSPTVASQRGVHWGARAGDGRVRVDAASLAFVADVASGAAEQRSTAADRHGRVPTRDNVPAREGLEREPVIHEAARALREAVIDAAGARPVRFVAPWPGRARWAAAFTHDLDVVAAWPLFAALRWAELARGGHLRRAARAIRAAARAAGARPVLDGIDAVLASESAHGVRSTWFVLCETPTLRTVRQGDVTYRPESAAARAAVARITGAGHEVGLHGSFATCTDAERFTAQRARLGALADREVAGVRQHFLRMRPGPTQRAMSAAGFAYDATFGFADRNGFRAGVADVIAAYFDDATGATLPLATVPLVWMDRALSKYSGVEEPGAWVADAAALAARARAVGGLWTGLWHPNLTPALGYPGAPEAYLSLLDTITGDTAYVAPAAEIVAWRAARRSARLSVYEPEGRLRVARVFDTRIALVDANGREDRALTARCHAAAEDAPRGDPQ